MTTYAFPFDAGAGSSVTEEQWRRMASVWLATGVLRDELDELEVYADGSAREVYVRAGKAWIRGHYFESDAQEPLAIGAADPTLDRIDRIVVRADFVANTIAFAVLQGVAAAVPVPPALTQDVGTHEVGLAQVAVGAGVTVIEDVDVTDERGLLVRVPGSSLPPFTREVSIASLPNGTTGWSPLTIGSSVPQEMAGGPLRVIADLSVFTQVRFFVRIQSNVPTTTAEVGVQYSVDGGTTWKALDSGLATEVGPSVIPSAQGLLASGWADLVEEARADVLLRPAGIAGAAPGSIIWGGNIGLEARATFL